MPQFIPYTLIAYVWLMEREIVRLVPGNVSVSECPGGGGVMVTV